jgi:hypothetical protein
MRATSCRVCGLFVVSCFLLVTGAATVSLGAKGKVSWVNPPGNKGKILEDGTGDGPRGGHVFRIPEDLSDPDYQPQVGDSVSFEPGPGRRAGDVVQDLCGAAGRVELSPREDSLLACESLPGFSLFISAGSALFPDGSVEGALLLSDVTVEPVEPGSLGVVFEISPAGVVFDPPAPIRIPNDSAFPPGESITLFSFDGELGDFVLVGPATVTEDGVLIVSDPGFGIVKGG